MQGDVGRLRYGRIEFLMMLVREYGIGIDGVFHCSFYRDRNFCGTVFSSKWILIILYLIL